MDPGIAWYHIDLVHTIKPQQVLSARGCNMSFRRELFDKFGLHFDERYRGSAVREESDFCLQFRKTNRQIWYDPDASLIHLGEETGGCHDIGTKSVQYQITFYHNHFFLGLHNLTPANAYAFLLNCLTAMCWVIPLVIKVVHLSKLWSVSAFISWDCLKR